MGFFDFLRRDDEEPEHREARLKREAASLEALNRGGLPFNAVERLQHQRDTQQLPNHLWTSDLSVSELSLVQDAGYEPLGQIMGASIYHVGFQWRTQNWRNGARQNGVSYELDTLSHAYAQARELALSRLYQEAKILGASGVVGVRLHRKASDWMGDSVEFQAIGTAIRYRGAPPAEEPFLCDLSGQDFWKLRQSGIMPVGIVAGNCTYYCIPGQNSRQATSGGFFNMGSWSNLEIPEYTQALFTAREIALDRLVEQARRFKAHGTVGMSIDYDARTYEVEVNKQPRIDMLYHFFVLGTAVREETRAPQVQTSRVLSLGFMPVRQTQQIGI